MRYRIIPGTDLECSCICLGTGGLGSALDKKASFEMLDTFRDMGGNFVDSANCYANWLPETVVERSASEKTIGRWMRERGCRDNVVVGTKGAHPDLKAMDIPRMRPADILTDLNDSLSNLQTDTIDLYWLHRDDPTRPVGEILGVLNSQVQAGKIRHFGCSNWRAPRIREAWEYAKAAGMDCFVGDQMMWSLAVIDAQAIGDPTIAVMDDGLMAFHRETGMAAIPFSSQANGLFAKFAAGGTGTLNQLHSRVYSSPENHARFLRIVELSRELGFGANDIALGYMMSQPFTTIPIIGPRNSEQLTDSLKASDISLTPEQVAYLAGQ